MGGGPEQPEHRPPGVHWHPHVVDAPSDSSGEITSARRIQWDHNFIQHSGGQPVSTTHVMKVSSNGQVSIPAEARARWKADHVVVVDLGDRVVLRPLPVDPVTDLQGKYRGRGPSSERARSPSPVLSLQICHRVHGEGAKHDAITEIDHNNMISLPTGAGLGGNRDLAVR